MTTTNGYQTSSSSPLPAPLPPPLTIEIDNPIIQKITLPKPLLASTWTVNLNEKQTTPQPFSGVSVLVGTSLQKEGECFISVEQDEAGRHLFVKLSDAIDQVQTTTRKDETLKLYKEEAVKTIKNVKLLYARREPPPPISKFPSTKSSSSTPTTTPPTKDMSHLIKDELAPHSPFTNYSIIPWLSLSPTSRLILSDEYTLLRPQPNDRIFDHVTLIVNCHQHSPDLSKYKIGTKNKQVISHAVHTWHGGGYGSSDSQDQILQKNDEIQNAIWQHLSNGGSVVVHCLAGIHRAACIVACHFLYRHHVLGQKYVMEDKMKIYELMQSVRMNVSPAYTHVLKGYEIHVKEKGVGLLLLKEREEEEEEGKVRGSGGGGGGSGKKWRWLGIKR